MGYILAVAIDAVMDKPDLIATVVVGDGEAKTDYTATAWHEIKYPNSAESGAVIPIVHINGFKSLSAQSVNVWMTLNWQIYFPGMGIWARRWTWWMKIWLL